MKLLFCVLLPTRLVIWWTRMTCRDHTRAPAARDSFIIFRLDALGDLVLTTPLFRELKRAYPNARITAVVQQAYRSILESNPQVDEVLSVPAVRDAALKQVRYLLTTLKFYWRELRGRRFDVAICPRWDTDEHLATLLCTLTTAELRVGYSERSSAGKRRFNKGFDRAFDICLEPGPLRHEVERNLAIVETLGVNANDAAATEIGLTAEDCEYANRVLHNVPADSVLVALGIGAQSPGRRWPLERYSAVIDELSKKVPVHTVITCAPSEHEQATHLARALSTGSSISDSAAIRETCALLERCDLFIGNDTGAAHLAAAMKCPTIVISRHPMHGDPEHPNSPARFAPWGVPASVLQPEHGLGDCDASCREISRPHCILEVSVPEVVSAAEALLIQNSRVRDKLITSSPL